MNATIASQTINDSTIMPSQLVQITLTAHPDDMNTLEEWLWVLPELQSMDSIYDGMPGSETVNGIKLVFSLAPIIQLDTWQNIIIEKLKSAPIQYPEALLITQTKTVKPEDWSESWKKHWGVTRVSNTLVIVPTWESYTPKSGEKMIKLDPGQAFGTGTHQTTRLMLCQLEKLKNELDFNQISALDVGCGSGVLAIGAAMMGVLTITSIDIQPESAIATMENAELNNVAHHITASTTALNELCQTKHKLVLANIIAPVINELLPEMLLRLEDGGRLLLSGLIEPNIAPLVERLEESGLMINEVVSDGDWRLIDALKA